MVEMAESNFIEFWYQTLKKGTPKELITHWRDYVLAGVQRGRHVVDVVNPFVDVHGCKVLDAGCGFGGTSIAFAMSGSQVVGIDVEKERLLGALIRARADYQIPSLSFQQSILEHLPFQDSSFDILICEDVFEHVNSHARSVAEIGRVLKPGGVVYLVFPNYFSPQNFWRDPHYDLLGVSILPKALAGYYVTRIRRRSQHYDVGYFPIASILKERFRIANMKIIWQNPVMKRQLGVLTRPAKTFLLNLYPLVEWVLQKGE